MMIREHDIKDSLGLSGNAVVLQEDRGNPIIRAALHLDEGSIPEDGVHDFGISWEEAVMKRIEDNQRKMVEMNKELRTLATMVEGGTCGVDVYGEADDGEEDNGQANDGHVDDEANEEAQCFETNNYTDACGCFEEERRTLRTFRMLHLL
ncbi:hypothetical protein V8G54_021528 [Vigna mungo]|uniref:Uncharacterized protein n=1 Tax=Vigna mungo TaxID=3915 RepID=A0AAQ3NG09_VIGMU